MKKLIISAVIVAIGFAANAASIKWATGAMYVPVDAAGTMGTSGAKDPKAVGANLYVFTIAEAAYTDYQKMSIAAASESIYNAYSSQLTAGNVKATTGAMGTGTWEETGLSSTATDYYAATIITYKDSSDKEWYVANIAKVTAGGAGATNAGMLGTKFDGVNGGTTAITKWTAAGVPEPTSGLLVMLGVGLMALRRRFA